MLTTITMEQETFEDAQDTASVRSLTRRTPSVTKRAQERDSAELDEEHQKLSKESTKEEKSDGEKENDRKSSALSAHRISQNSNGDLDNVNLDDDATTTDSQGDEDKSSPITKEASKTLSLSSITSALPAMPWSPPAGDSPHKNPLAAPSPPVSYPPPAERPPPRKLTSPFSWLSRNSAKDTTSTSPPAVSPRRNTASSVATLTSNPEMMLSKLEEEGQTNGINGTHRNSLKDRFKLMRMREEAGISAIPGEEDKTGGGAVAALIGRSSTGLGLLSPTIDEKENSLGIQPPTSPIPTSPNPSLAPGTASGVNAGPSTFSDIPVDWDLWQSVVYEGPAAVAKTSSEELNRAIATGIPSAIRGVIWQVLAQSKNEELEVVYRELVARGTDKDKDRQSNSSLSASSNGNLSIHKEPVSSASSVHSDQSAVNGAPSPSEKDPEALMKAQAAAVADRKKKEKEDAAMLQKLEKTIRRDLGTRTSYSKFAAAQGLQDGLFGVCKAYALFDEGVGYAQGMNFLVMPILFNMPEEEAFCLLVRLMNHYHLRDLFIQDMPGLHMHLYQFERLLEDLEPALYCHLRRRGISPHLYATQWFLTLFAYRFPLQLVLRIYDLILSEGLSAILKFGIVLMQKNAATLLGMSDMSQLTTFLKDRLFDVYIDAAPNAGSILENGFFGSSSSAMDKEVYRADQLIHDACEVKITPEVLKFYKSEWEEKTRAEKERELELENLRTSNIKLTNKVRKLEERLEAVDREQADLATELVHTKVQNEELKDENESLKGQVRELRLVIEKQPQEIEETWNLERDNLMKRNQNVHEENQRLEKELSELEEELVQTKMRYAEVNSQYETLTRRWTDLKRQMAD
ncbi:putative gtpase activating protein [Phaeoacremonium minimum UCRPA7]|uniref:GTPase-activating protein GYP5 n=1 Tax=Phaeoacremonium minimum (strain UCR-PA7) TaxID=1286976 RepID=R8BJ13_PHAM7|nr:putative gtpase activating protein [Phaeoacremonium minimum UCRPA7]EON99318.1 putative gtpase activating protein [Phaeoacremonium minimum UCRPA7]